jgi:hypothetical protein
MKAVSVIVVTDQEVAFEVNVDELASSNYNKTIEQVNDALLDGDKSGTVDLGDDVFSWWIKNEKDVKTKNISVIIKKLSDFKNDERELLVEYADLISQDETDPKLILYSNSLSDILDTLEYDEEYCDSNFNEFKAILNDMIIAGADQYIFE